MTLTMFMIMMIPIMIITNTIILKITLPMTIILPMTRSYNNFTHWVHEYMRRPPFSGLLEGANKSL